MTDVEPDDDFLDGCDEDFTVDDQLTGDDQVVALVLFADVDFEDPNAVQARVSELGELHEAGFAGGPDDGV